MIKLSIYKKINKMKIRTFENFKHDDNFIHSVKKEKLKVINGSKELKQLEK